MAPQLQERKRGSTWEMWTSTLLFPHFRATACWLLRYHPGTCLIHRVPLPFVSEKWMGLDSNLLSLVWLVNVNQWHKWEGVWAQFHRAWTPLLGSESQFFLSQEVKRGRRGAARKEQERSWAWKELFTTRYSEQSVLHLSALLLLHFVVFGEGVWF